MASILEIAGYVQDQGEQGRKRGLASLVGKAYGSPREERQAILGAVASRGAPQMAYDANKHFEGMDETARERLGQYAAAFDALPDEQKPMAYPQLAKQAQELGIPAPGEWNPEFAPHIQKLAMSLQGGKGGAVPTGFQELHMKALAAGLRPGSAEYQQAMNISLGREGRAATGGFGFELIEGMDGSKRMARKNPRTGAFEVYDESSGQFVPFGGPGALNGGQLAPVAQGPMAPQQGASSVQGLVSSLAGQYGGQVSSLQRSPQHNADVGGVANSQHISGTAGDVVVPQANKAAFIAAARAQGLEAIDEGDHIHLELPPGRSQPQGGNPAMAVSRRPEDEAAAVEGAKQNVALSYLPKTEGIKADAAVAQSLAIDRNKAGVDMEKVGMERSRDAETTLALLEDAEQLVKMSTGSALGNARDSALGMIGKSTQGGEAISALQTIAGQLTSKMPRMQGPQSDKDVELYKQMAGDLANPNLPRGRRLAALAQIRRLNQKYTQSQQQAAPGGTGGWGIRAKK